MSLLQWAPFIALFFAAVFKAALSHTRARRVRALMPPAPPGIPFLGNTFQVPKVGPWLRFTEWAEKYGPIVSLNLAGQHVVVLNSFKSAIDLLDHRSALYSDRPRFIVAGEMMTGGMFLGFTRYGSLWRRMRRAAHETFNIRAVEIYRPLQARDAAVLVSNLLRDPSRRDEHFERAAASTIVSVLYGGILDDETREKVVARINGMVQTVATAAGAGAHLVEVFPSLLYLPDWAASWKRSAKALFNEYSTMLENLMSDTRKAGKNTEHAFAKILIDNQERYRLSPKESAWLAAVMLSAGADTTAGSLCTLLLAVLHHPEVQQRAHEELDTVIGRNRLPTFEDQENLPYINAVVKELLRWLPVAPLGMPRRCMQDDWYEGYLIPKGTVVMENLWGVSRDPACFPDAEKFRPERFLDPHTTIPAIMFEKNAQKHFGFGFGRRICAGRNLAYQALYIDVACILWALHISPELDEKGRDILPSKSEFIDTGLIVRPAPFPCQLRPRFEGVIGVIESRVRLGIVH